MDSIIEPPQELFVPLKVEEPKLMGPGPSNAHSRVLSACAQPILGLFDHRFWKIMDEVKLGLQYLWQTKNKVTLVVSGSGHAGIEASIMNFTERGERILICVNGVWGEKVSEMAERIDCDVKKIEKPIGNVFSVDDIKKGLEAHKPSVLFITHGESSGTTCQPLEGIAEICHENNCIVVVDSVASLGGVPLNVDKLGLDVVYSGSQKCLGCPPGLSPITLSPRAWQKLLLRKTKIPSYYFDLTLLANFWGCDEGPRRYHHTCLINNIYSLRESLALIVEEGRDHFIARHEECAKLFQDGLEKMGFEIFVKEKEHRLPTITGVVLPSGKHPQKIAAYISEKYKMDVSGGLGPSAGIMLHVGLMGVNSTKENVDILLKAFKDAVEKC